MTFKTKRSWYEPLFWFLSQLRWSAKDFSGDLQARRESTCTYLELVIASDLLTGGAIGPRSATIGHRVTIFRRLWQSVLKHCGLIHNRSEVSPKVFFSYRDAVPSLDSFGISRQSGFMRAPLWNFLPGLANNIAGALVKLAREPSIMSSLLPPTYIIKPIWCATSVNALLALSFDLIQARSAETGMLAKGAVSKRAFIRDNLESNRCRKPHVIPRVSVSSKLSGKRLRTGPCFFGHSTTSGKDRMRNERWNVCPAISPWPSLVSPGDTLCQRCYQLHLRCKARGIPTTIPLDYTIARAHSSSTSALWTASSASSAFSGRPPGVGATFT